ANTPAADMDGAVPLPERRRRNKMLNILSEKKRRAFYERHRGDIRPVLLEKGREEGVLHGFTDNYIKVEFPAEDSWVNHLVELELNPEAPINGKGNGMTIGARVLEHKYPV
ncbi:MAG: tRNA (N(6)-L-threonylcarbamoyladenosine(37)-C(2))-methylthiotransferase MtaB, partial [Lewinella sp.]